MEPGSILGERRGQECIKKGLLWLMFGSEEDMVKSMKTREEATDGRTWVRADGHRMEGGQR